MGPDLYFLQARGGSVSIFSGIVLTVLGAKKQMFIDEFIGPRVQPIKKLTSL